MPRTAIRIKRLLTVLTLAHLIVAVSQQQPSLAQSKPDGDLTAALRKIVGLINRHDFDAAAPLAEATVAHYPQSYEARVMRGNVYNGLEEDEKALRDYQWALKARPKDAAVLEAVAGIQFAQGKDNEALASINEAIKNSTVNSGVNELLEFKRRILKHEHRYVEAEEVVDLMLSHVPNHPHWVRERLKLRIENKEWPGAIADATFCLPLMPQFKATLLQDRAKAYAALGQNEKAIQDLKEALRSDPGNRLMHVDLLEVYKRSGKKQLADDESKFLKRLGEGI